jgi:hypothetical protein
LTTGSILAPTLNNKGAKLTGCSGTALPDKVTLLLASTARERAAFPGHEIARIKKREVKSGVALEDYPVDFRV